MVFLHQIAAMIVFPNAKINLGLRITSKRSDGYHDIETVFHPVMLFDALEFIVAPQGVNADILTVTGFDAGSSADNLVLKAAAILRKRYKFPFLKFHLHKGIPPGAGLGGGSADSACVLKAVSKFFGLPAEDDLLHEMALTLGSDCPFFIRNVPSHATGRGEILKPAQNIKGEHYLVLLNPGIHASTKDAYAECRPQQPATSLDELITLPVEEWKDRIVNDFEFFVFRKHPVIGELKQSLYDAGALFSLMSGSGSTVYGIFRNKTVLPAALKQYVIYEGRM
jgi:4-diphosphocytidyl-2-C-methyl-D-erythritol kinase